MEGDARLVGIGQVRFGGALIGGPHRHFFRDDIQHQLPKFVRELFRLGLGAAAGCHQREPGPQKRVLDFLRRRKITPPADQRLGIEARGFGRFRRIGPRLREQDAAHTHHVACRLGGHAGGDFGLGMRDESFDRLLLRAHFGLLRPIALHFGIRRQRILGISRRGEDAAESIVILLRNRVELMVVASCPGNGESQKPFVGASIFRRAHWRELP